MEAEDGEGTAVSSGSGDLVYARPKIERLPGKPNGKNSVGNDSKIQSEKENNSVGKAKKIQSPTSGKTSEPPTEKNSDDCDDWRFEIKRKKRDAGRKNSGSTAKKDWYYWVIRIRKSDGFIMYYGTLDVLDESNPARLHKYWQRSKGRKK
jgi:hypothetical protein